MLASLRVIMPVPTVRGNCLWTQAHQHPNDRTTKRQIHHKQREKRERERESNPLKICMGPKAAMLTCANQRGNNSWTARPNKGWAGARAAPPGAVHSPHERKRERDEVQPNRLGIDARRRALVLLQSPCERKKEREGPWYSPLISSGTHFEKAPCP